MKINDFVEMWHDKRFSKKFTLLNFLTNDYLRNYLAVRVEIPFLNLKQKLRDKNDLSKTDIMILNNYCKKVEKGLDDVFHL